MRKVLPFLVMLSIFAGCAPSPRYRTLRAGKIDVAPSTSPVKKTPDKKTFETQALLEEKQDENLQGFVNLYLGTPYKLGGDDNNGMDCSGFVGRIYKQVYGISLPRKVKDIWKTGMEVSAKNIKQGDLVFFRRKGTNGPTHIGIYIGDNKFAHSTRSLGVTISKLDDPYWSKIFVGARRVQ